jgi:acyl-CoA thioesterase FadM
MARVRLDLPSHFIFQTDIAVRISDINYGSHLGNDAVLSLIHEARVRFLLSQGWSELDIDGFGLIITDAVIVYKSQGYHGDVLRVALSVGDFGKYGCDFYYRLTQTPEGREIARAKTGIVFYDYAAGKIVPMPAAFRNRFPEAR